MQTNFMSMMQRFHGNSQRTNANYEGDKFDTHQGPSN